jgi:hypothetical protein
MRGLRCKRLRTIALLYGNRAWKIINWNEVLDARILAIFSTLYMTHTFNPLKAELNPICPLLALFGAHYILHVGR